MIDENISYRGYTMKPKLDFGNKPFLINGEWVSSGIVVTDGVCNVMPGATWFMTKEDAIQAIDILIDCGDDSNRFWDTWRKRNESATSKTGVV